MLAALLAKIAAFAGKYLTFVLLGALIVTAVLWLLERRANMGLAERNGKVTAANASQAHAIEELKADRARLESALFQREVDRADLQEKLARAKAATAAARNADPEYGAWDAQILPAYVRAGAGGLLRAADGGANGGAAPHSARSAPYGDAGAVVERAHQR